MKSLIVGISGASGTVYGLRMLEVLKKISSDSMMFKVFFISIFLGINITSYD